jgi:hypothetical protein
MDTKFICGGEKYNVYGDNRAIGMPILLTDIPKEITLQGNAFYFPSPFHVTLFYTEHVVDRYNISIPNFKDKAVDDFCEFTKQNKIEFVKYTNDFRLVVKNDSKKSIMVRCKVSNLNEFFDFINNKYDLKIKYPTPHVTLYNTRKGEHGMYLMDSDDIANFTIPIENPIGREL